MAGKRAGLAGARSGLFMEQIRVIKEMRENDRASGRADNLIRPRYMVWENVFGAFSSNKGEDFRAVLEETAKVADKDAVIPGPPKGKWSPSGCIVGDGWSIAWRVHDAQFWGVPQRRKRIALVADFGGASAPEILFEREGLSGDSPEGGKEREGAAADVGTGVKETGGTINFQERAGKPGGSKGILIQNERVDALSTANCQAVLPINTMVATRTTDEKRTTFGIGADGDPQFSLTATHEHGVACLNDQGGGVMSVSVNVSGTLRAQEHGHQPIVYGISAYDSNAMKSSNPHSGIYEAETTRTLDNNGGNPACNQGGMIVLEGNGTRESHRGDGYKESETMFTLNTVEQHAVCMSQDAYDKFSENEKSASLRACGGSYGGVRNNGDTVGALCASDYKGVGNQYVTDGKCIIQRIE